VPGVLVVFEGIEGVGKTTQVRVLLDHLARAGVPAAGVREPGGTAIGDAIRGMLLDPTRSLDPRTEALLFMASRAQLVQEVIRPALAADRFVVADRFFLSTYAYQVAGRGLPEDQVRQANALATGGLVPDLTLLLDLEAGEGLRRAGSRSAHDRMERSGDAFHERVREAFRTFATRGWQEAHPETGPVALVDATGPQAEVTARVLDVLARHWPRTFQARAGSHS
jgi:dTMP kinase